MITNLLPNHATSIYREMTGAVEERIFHFDLKEWLRGMYQNALEAEFEVFMELAPYERSLERRTQRNGFYERSLDTVYGALEGLRVPRDRRGLFRTTVFKRHQRREAALDRLITECFWRGISTRDMKKILKQLSGVEVSSSTVSRLTEKWQKEVFQWHQRRISDDYVYLFLDGVWIKNRSLGEKRRLILVAFGIKADGTKEVIDYMLSVTEKEEHWAKFLQHLSYRGLEGKNLKLIVTDGCHGLWNAVDLVFPGISQQTCWAHKIRNILGNVKKSDQPEVHKLLKPLFSKKTDSRAKAEKVVNKWKKTWRKKYPEAVRSLEAAEDRLINYFDCPLEHHSMIRTTNHIERVFKEFRRRMRPMEITPNAKSADRILYALVQIRNEKLIELKKYQDRRLGRIMAFTQK